MPTPLETFASNQSEDAFRRLVDEFGGLVFTSALRRTGDASLAEEVTQNVFAILAGKAGKLTRHPSLSGWLFTTTKLESSKVMRARKRHTRKMEALADELSAEKIASTPEEGKWLDAIPHLDDSLDRLPRADRELLLARFFEERSFKDIARESGKSEAACKMRVKRTLTKLNRWLGAKGVTLSVTTLGAALSAELSKAAPAALTTAIPAKSIAAASAAGAAATGGSTIVTNVLHTMNAMKTSAAAAAAVLAIGSAPIIIQYTDARDLEAELTSLENQRTSFTATNSGSALGKPGQSLANKKNAQVGTTPIQRLLSAAKRPASGEELMETMQNAMLNQDMATMLRTFVPLAKIGELELQKLISEVQASTSNLQVKPVVLQLLTGLTDAAGSDPGGALDRNLASAAYPLNFADDMTRWAKKDPDAALAWFRKNQKNGSLHGKGIHDSAEPHLAAALAVALLKTNPDQAIALADEIDPAGRATVIERLAGALVTQDQAGRQRAQELIASVSDPDGRARILEHTVMSMTRADQRDKAVEFLQTMELKPTEQARALAAGVTQNNSSGSVSERMQWLLENAPRESRSQAIDAAVSRLHWSEGTATTEWIDALPQGADRDTALNAEAMSMMGQNNRESALERALLIGDEAARRGAALRILRFWQRTNPAGAAEAAQSAGIDLPSPSN